MPFKGPAALPAGFNPRLRTGGDSKPSGPKPTTPSFNPRLRTGGDLGWVCYYFKSSLFQSTPPHGRRRALTPGVLSCAPFQSTPPHGRRLEGVGKGAPADWFQSTPPHGRRQADT